MSYTGSYNEDLNRDIKPCELVFNDFILNYEEGRLYHHADFKSIKLSGIPIYFTVNGSVLRVYYEDYIEFFWNIFASEIVKCSEQVLDLFYYIYLGEARVYKRGNDLVISPKLKIKSKWDDFFSHCKKYLYLMKVCTLYKCNKCKNIVDQVIPCYIDFNGEYVGTKYAKITKIGQCTIVYDSCCEEYLVIYDQHSVFITQKVDNLYDDLMNLEITKIVVRPDMPEIYTECGNYYIRETQLMRLRDGYTSGPEMQAQLKSARN